MSQDKQLGLFPVGTMRRPLGRAHVGLARRVVRRVWGRGPTSEADLAEALGCDRDDLRLALGIAIRWRKVRRDGGQVVAVPREVTE